MATTRRARPPGPHQHASHARDWDEVSGIHRPTSDLRRPTSERWLLLGAPVAAVLAGLAAEWLDFRALRYPLLLMVGIGVLATALPLFGRERPLRAFVLTLLLGAATWGAVETLYVVLHVAQGESFDAERFGPQWRQAFGLIGVHALFLGVPTGIVAGVLRHFIARTRA